MTDETPSSATPAPATPDELAEAGRVRIDGPPRRLDALPVVYVVGFLILAAAVIYLWRHPSMPAGAAAQAQHVDTIQHQMEALRQQVDALSGQVQGLQGRTVPDVGRLEQRVAALEAKPAPAAPNLGPIEAQVTSLAARPQVDLRPLEAKVAALEGKPAVDLKPLEGQVAALAARPVIDLKPLEARVGALEAKPPVDLGPLTQRVEAGAKQAADGQAALGARLGQEEAATKQNVAAIAAITQRAQLAGRLQSMGAALGAGQPLGDVPGAPPALAKFAHQAPPTESGLRLAFDAAAAKADAASQPAITQDQGLFGRMWTRAQQSVTVRQGDRVIVGDPIAGVLEHSRQLLDAGDLAGCVRVLDEGLAGPAKAAMADWIGQAQALLDARRAIGELAAQG